MKSNLNSKQIVVLFSVLVVGGLALLFNACRKAGQQPAAQSMMQSTGSLTNKTTASQPITEILNVVTIQNDGGTGFGRVAFSKHEMYFNIANADMLSRLQSALKTNTALNVQVDAATASIIKMEPVAQNEVEKRSTMRKIDGQSTSINMDDLKANPTMIDHIAEMAVVNTTTDSLTAMIPDMATAQQIFDYFATQCCRNPGPFDITYCIPFQYCGDGCYARANIMCWLLNNKYHYATQKLFSFAVGGYTLSVHAEKWCGTCVNWWYHVAPLVTIKTTAGPKAYIFDPSMFDQPVPYATWLHWMENPDCASGNAKVTSINVQPTSSFWPGSPTVFYQDSAFYNTDYYLVYYKTFHTCP